MAEIVEHGLEAEFSGKMGQTIDDIGFGHLEPLGGLVKAPKPSPAGRCTGSRPALPAISVPLSLVHLMAKWSAH